MFEGLPERLTHEIKTLSPPNTYVNVIARPDRNYLAFKGASTITSLRGFEDCWFTNDEYDEYGPAFVHRKCQ